MKLYLLAILQAFAALNSFAQNIREVSGSVTDSAGILPGSTVMLIVGKDTAVTLADVKGEFLFKNVQATAFEIYVSSVGYLSIKRQYAVKQDEVLVNLAPIVLRMSSTTLDAVTISATTAIKVKEDTLEYRADAYQVRDGAPVEDIIRKLPGVDVDKDGSITAQGKPVTRVRVNGKDFMGGDVKAATQNLPANIIENIQLIDDYGDQANLSGVKSGEADKVINITIKADMNYGYSGQATLAAGSDAQTGLINSSEDKRYQASANLLTFAGNRQFTFMGNLNNTNSRLFSFSSNGARSNAPGNGGGNRGTGGGEQAGAGGITTARSLGLNYRDQWGKKISVYGSYSFTSNTVQTLTSTIQNNTTVNQSSRNSLTNSQADENVNHRFNFNMEYKLDSMNYLKFVPSISYSSVGSNLAQTNSLTRNSQAITDYSMLSVSESSSPNFGASLLFNHKFNHPGRSFNINVSGGSARLALTQNPVYTYLTGQPNVPLNQHISNEVKGDSITAALSYTEPLSTRSYLELNYAYRYNTTTAYRQTDTLTSDNSYDRYDLLTNNYHFYFATNRIGVNYKFIDKDYNYTLGIALLPAVLNGYSNLADAGSRVATFNIAPTARFIYIISPNRSLSVSYSGASNAPTYNMLQPVLDFSNATYPVEGNPALKPEFSNNLTARFTKFDNTNGNALFAGLTFIKTSNKVVANSISYPQLYTPDPKLAGTILTKYQNGDGFFSVSGNFSYSKPWQQRRYTFFLNGNVTYNNNISYISSLAEDNFTMTSEKNIARNLIFMPSTKFKVSIPDFMDSEIFGSYSIINTNNSLPENEVINNFRVINLGINGKNYLWKAWTLGYDYVKTTYQGYIGATNPNILNAFVERRFLKNNVGTLRLAAFDVFNQNTSFSTTQTGNYITQTQTNRLGRYYLLSFALKLQKFAGKLPDNIRMGQ